VDITATVETGVAPEVLFAWVDDLARYPQWLEIVSRAVPAPPAEHDPGPAWSVDLRGRLGPLARSKRLRMVRTVHDQPHRAAFERLEIDGRTHALWRLTATVAARSAGAALTMHLHYGGRMVGRPVEMLLAQEIERSRERLLALVAASGR
jgi:hypothetical protein